MPGFGARNYTSPPRRCLSCRWGRVRRPPANRTVVRSDNTAWRHAQTPTATDSILGWSPLWPSSSERQMSSVGTLSNYNLVKGPCRKRFFCNVEWGSSDGNASPNGKHTPHWHEWHWQSSWLTSRSVWCKALSPVSGRVDPSRITEPTIRKLGSICFR